MGGLVRPGFRLIFLGFVAGSHSMEPNTRPFSRANQHYQYLTRCVSDQGRLINLSLASNPASQAYADLHLIYITAACRGDLAD
jgi:hypothetical protein